MAPALVTALVILFSAVMVIMLAREIRRNNARRRSEADKAKRLQDQSRDDR